MRVTVRRSPLGAILQWAQRGLFAGAILMLGYCGFVLANTWMFQHRGKQVLERTRQMRMVSSPAVGLDGLIGHIEIPRLGVSAVVVEGTEESALRRAAGHIEGTAFPGQAGNVGIAGHRDTFFRPLRNIKRDDVIALTTLHGEYRYRVVSTKVVSPSNVAVLNPDGHEILTLVTCYPFYFVGSAPERFIVRAERIQPEVARASAPH
jgi:sortase A